MRSPIAHSSRCATPVRDHEPLVRWSACPAQFGGDRPRWRRNPAKLYIARNATAVIAMTIDNPTPTFAKSFVV